MRESESVSQSNHLSPKHRQTNIKDVGPRKEIVVYYPLPINISVILVADAAKDSGADQQNCILDVLLLMDCTVSKMPPREGGGGGGHGKGKQGRGARRSPLSLHWATATAGGVSGASVPHPGLAGRVAVRIVVTATAGTWLLSGRGYRYCWNGRVSRRRRRRTIGRKAIQFFGARFLPPIQVLRARACLASNRRPSRRGRGGGWQKPTARGVTSLATCFRVDSSFGERGVPGWVQGAGGKGWWDIL